MPDGLDDVGASLPETEPHPAPIFDTGPHPQPLLPKEGELRLSTVTAPGPVSAPGPNGPELQLSPEDPMAPWTPVVAGWPAVSEPLQDSAADGWEPPPVISVTGQYQHLKWWKLVLVLIAVWIPAAGIGLGLYYWWFSDPSGQKVLPVFVVLTYVVVCTVASLLLANVNHKPLVAAAAIAVMSAPFASAAGAAPLYGHYFCAVPVATRCAMGVVPY